MDEFKPDDLNLDMGKSDKDLSPTPFEGSGGPETEVSHAPLNLGGGNASSPAPAAKPTPKRAAKSQAPVTPGDRITGVRIFFTKLHAGALDFLSEQITEWLKTNPNITIKRTNITVGEIAAKKTEANLIITVWY
jgi:hypothetical protein